MLLNTFQYLSVLLSVYEVELIQINHESAR